MTHPSLESRSCLVWPRWWRMTLIALCTLILCSCRSAEPVRPAAGPGQVAAPGQAVAPMPGGSGVVPAAAWMPQNPSNPAAIAMPATAVASGPIVMSPEGPVTGVPMPYEPVGPWAPPGLAGPWPRDEYLLDGGDKGLDAQVTQNWQIHGLEVEDTIAHFDTLDGRTMVEPSNQVTVYAPRFRSVRQVEGLNQNEERVATAGVSLPVALSRQETAQVAGTSKQQVQPGGQYGRKQTITFHSKQGDGAVSSGVGLQAFQDGFQPYENLSAIRLGRMEEAEMLRLAEGATAAIAWTHKQAVQIMLDHQWATVEVQNEHTQSVFTVKSPPPNPKVRVIKVASTPFAEPNDTVDFTIRFDNIGNQVVGNVTVVDNLSTRLEFIPGSAQCSVPANFSTQPNDAGSMALRWEIINPVEVNQGGIVRFRCRVR